MSQIVGVHRGHRALTASAARAGSPAFASRPAPT
jgi:hypothetical protein